MQVVLTWLGFAADFGSRFRKLAENSSRIWRKTSSHFECSLYILNGIGFCLCHLIDRKENIPIDAMRGGEEKAFQQLCDSIAKRPWLAAAYSYNRAKVKTENCKRQ